MNSPVPVFVVSRGGVRNTRGKVRRYESFAEFVETWQEPTPLDDLTNKKDLPYFVGGVLNGKRDDGNVQARTLLTLDVEAADDDRGQPPRPAKVVKAMEEAGFDGWLYTTSGHTAKAPRYRIVLPLAEPIAGADMARRLEAATRAAARALGVQDWCKPESWVLSQAMFLPAQVQGRQAPYSRTTTGKPFEATVAETDPQTDQRPTSETPADIPDGKLDPVLQALKKSGLYLRANPKQRGMHFITCPFLDAHGKQTDNETQTAYYEAHYGGNPRPAVHCFDTDADHDGKKRLTYRILVAWLREQGHLGRTDENDDTEAVLEDTETFFSSSAVGEMLDTDAVPLEFAIAGFAPLGMVTVLAGPGGVSKSSLALRLLLAASTGSPFGPFKVSRPMRCLYVSYEDDRRTFHARLRTMYDALVESADGFLYEVEQVRRNLRIAAVAGEAESWVLMRKAERYGTPTATERVRVAWLRELLRHFRLRLLVLDPAAFTHRLEENDPAEMAAFMQMLGALAAQADCAIVLLHHMQKAAAWMALDEVNQGSLRGASSLADNARSVAVMMSVSKKDAPKFGLPDTDATVSRYAVIKHVKHNHSASLGVHVFEHQGALLMPRPTVQRLPDHEVEELRAATKAQRRANKLDVRALKAVEHLLAYDNEPLGTNQIRMDVFGGDPQTSVILKHGESVGWIENQGLGQRHEWVATVDGREAVRAAAKPSKYPSR